MSTVTLDEIIAQVRSVPQLSATTVRLLRTINDPASTIAQIVESIRYDHVVTTDLLRLCNSAYFGLARKVATLDDAVSYLGTAKILQLVIAAPTRTLLSRPQEGYGLAPEDLWTHSVAVALASQLLAKRFGLAEANLVFTAGLLHDIGKTVLNEYVAAEYTEIARRVAHERVSFLDAERDVLGFTHAEIGGRIAEHWELPGPIVDAIRYHHEPAHRPAPTPLVDAVHVADAICLSLGLGLGSDGLLYRADPTVLARHRLSESYLESIGAETVTELKSVQRLFAVS